ncbi:MAG: sigma-70 family RNA polymerase sigma factor [Specibacter sp.]
MDNSLQDVFNRDWPRIVGAVARYTQDLALAEDCVQEAILKVVEMDGTVELRNVAAWITTTARHLAVDMIRRDQTLARSLPAMAKQLASPQADTDSPALDVFAGDDRLVLMALIATPQLSEEDRLALTLRFVLGVPTRDVAEVLLIPEPTMAARMTRAKKRLRANPSLVEAGDDASAALVHQRIGTLLDTLYLLYTAGYLGGIGRPTRVAALELGRELAAYSQGHLEAQGLLALMLLTEARQGAPDSEARDSFDVKNLENADRTQWAGAMIVEGMTHAAAALPGGGRFALQAGISGLHDAAPCWADTDWDAIGHLYNRLLAIWPAPSVELNRTIARSMSTGVGPSRALDELDASFAGYGGRLRWQAWAARAGMLHRLDRPAEAVDAYRHALEGAVDAGDRAYLEQRIRELGSGA